ncbi:hypothetical protein Sjap_004621 [Stephania japonica]|uniref:Uncharacterized protein n=1 Tax=Stephania japonica TaxID=461633 RepID=A0AAP0K2K1_9MAGN
MGFWKSRKTSTWRQRVVDGASTPVDAARAAPTRKSGKTSTWRQRVVDGASTPVDAARAAPTRSIEQHQAGQGEDMRLPLSSERIAARTCRMWNILNSTSEITMAHVRLSEYVIKRYQKPLMVEAEQVEVTSFSLSASPQPFHKPA